MTCNCNSNCTCSDTEIKQIVQDAVADQAQNFQDLTDKSQASQTGAAASEQNAANSAKTAKGFSDTASDNATAAADSAQQSAKAASAAATSAASAYDVTSSLKTTADSLSKTASDLSADVDSANSNAAAVAAAVTNAEALEASAKISAGSAQSSAQSANASAAAVNANTNAAAQSASLAQQYAATSVTAANDSKSASAAVDVKLQNMDLTIQNNNAIMDSKVTQASNAAANSSSSANTSAGYRDSAQSAASAAKSSETTAVSAAASATDAASKIQGYITASQTGIKSYDTTSNLQATSPDGDQVALAEDTRELWYYSSGTKAWSDLGVTLDMWLFDLKMIHTILDSESDTSVNDYTGTSRKTWHGIEQEWEAFKTAYQDNGGVLAFANSGTLTAYTPSVSNVLAQATDTGIYYYWDGSAWNKAKFQPNSNLRDLRNISSNMLEAISILTKTTGDIGDSVNTLNTDVSVLQATSKTLTTNLERRSSDLLTSIAVLANTLESLTMSIDTSYVGVTAFDNDRLNLLMLTSQLLNKLQGLDSFDPASVLTKADVADIGGGNNQSLTGSFALPEPSSIVHIDLTADSIPGSKTDDPVNATVVLTVDGAVYSGKCQISVQGATSAAYPKKNLNMDLTTSDFSDSVDLKIGDILPHDTWVFKANWVDATQVRNLSSYRLWQQFQAARSGWPKFDIDNTYVGKLGADGFPTGATACPVGYPCVTYINGEFYGIGTIAVGKKRKNYNLPKNKPTQIQVDIGNWFDISKFSDNYTTNAELKAPSKPTDATVASLKGWDNFASMAQSDFASNISKYTDKNNLIDFYLFTTLIGAADLINPGNDNLVKNFQFVTWDGTKFFFMPYDLDTVVGNNWAGGYSYGPTDRIPWCVGSFWDNVRAVYGDAIKARYTVLRNKGVIDNDNIYNLVTDIQNKYSADLFNAEVAKWSTTNPALPFVSSNGREQILNWYSARIAALDTYFTYTA